MATLKEDPKFQFNFRSKTFEASAHWLRDPGLIAAHVKMAGKASGKALEICCGNGAVARALNAVGWDVTGIDISENMVKEASKHVPAVVGDVRQLPYADQSIDLVVMRHAYSLLDDGPGVLREIHRVLRPGGKFILSHAVPFSDVDEDHLEKVHSMKQPSRRFHTEFTLTQDLNNARFVISAQANVTVRESVSLWLQDSPELDDSVRQEVCRLVVNAPDEYRKLRHVQVIRGEIFENWNFILVSAAAQPH